MMFKQIEGQRIYYLACPRTASTSTTELLSKLGFFQTSLAHDIAPRYFISGDIIITTVRNHLTWFQSCHRLMGGDCPFNTWMLGITRPRGFYFGVPWTRKLNGQWKLFWKYAPHANIIWKFEHLQEQIQETLGPFFPGHKLDLPHRNNHDRSGRDLQAYTESTKQLVLDTFEEEMNFYGYTP